MFSRASLGSASAALFTLRFPPPSSAGDEKEALAMAFLQAEISIPDTREALVYNVGLKLAECIARLEALHGRLARLDATFAQCVLQIGREAGVDVELFGLDGRDIGLGIESGTVAEEILFWDAAAECLKEVAFEEYKEKEEGEGNGKQVAVDDGPVEEDVDAAGEFVVAEEWSDDEEEPLKMKGRRLSTEGEVVSDRLKRPTHDKSVVDDEVGVEEGHANIERRERELADAMGGKDDVQTAIRAEEDVAINNELEVDARSDADDFVEVCPICVGPLDEHYNHPLCRHCQTRCCISCIGDLITKDRHRLPFTCPGKNCHGAIGLEEIIAATSGAAPGSPPRVLKYVRVGRRLEVLSEGRGIVCPDAKCRGVVMLKGGDVRMANCDVCDKLTCLGCGHAVVVVDQEDWEVVSDEGDDDMSHIYRKKCGLCGTRNA
ncbi:hypothetical protein HK101_000198 [Irineochytrium annulatum]|nr:hypothetical protein HK101_000198 [Irineochytrium annulatum]